MYVMHSKVTFAHFNSNNSHQRADGAHALPKRTVFSWQQKDDS